MTFIYFIWRYYILNQIYFNQVESLISLFGFSRLWHKAGGNVKVLMIRIKSGLQNEKSIENNTNNSDQLLI